MIDNSKAGGWGLPQHQPAIPPLALGRLGTAGPPPAPPPPGFLAGAAGAPRPSSSWGGGGGLSASRRPSVGGAWSEAGDSPAVSRPGTASATAPHGGSAMAAAALLAAAGTTWQPGGAGSPGAAATPRPGTAPRALPFAGGGGAWSGAASPRPGTPLAVASPSAASPAPQHATVAASSTDAARWAVAQAAARLAGVASSGEPPHTARPATAVAALGPPPAALTSRPGTAVPTVAFNQQVALPTTTTTTRPGTAAAALPPALVSSLRAALAAPAPSHAPAPVRCTVLRERGSRGAQTYRLLLEGGDGGAPPRQLAVAARTGRRALTIFDAGGPAGVVRGNALGSSYTLTVAGSGAGRDEEARLAKVAYRASLAGGRGPRRVAAVVAVPSPTGGGLGAYSSPSLPSTPPTLLALANRPPRWSAEAGAYTLDFGGRVTVASVKNCQLMVAAGGGGGHNSASPPVLLQFGKTGPDSFSLDYRAPLSGLAAFGLALTALDGKLACE